jgi:hypothetical protein
MQSKSAQGVKIDGRRLPRLVHKNRCVKLYHCTSDRWKSTDLGQFAERTTVPRETADTKKHDLRRLARWTCAVARLDPKLLQLGKQLEQRSKAKMTLT